MIEAGELFERGEVNFPDVQRLGLPPSASASRPDLAGGARQTMGLARVLRSVARLAGR